MLFTVIFLITSVFQVYEFYLLFQCFLQNSKTNRFFVILAYMGLFIMTTVPYLLFNIPIVTLICSYAGTLLVTLVYEGTWKIKILSGTFTMGIMVWAECVVAVFSGYIGLKVFQSNEYHSMFGTVCLPIVEFMIVLIVRNFKNMKSGENVSALYWIISITLPIVSVYLLLLFYRQPYLNSFDVICCILILFIINIFVFYLYDKQMQNFRIKQEKETLELQSKYQLNEMELMYGTVEKSKSLRHDFLKHISMISYLNEQGNKEELAEYLEEIQNNVKLQQKYIETGNFVFDSILNYKIQTAMEEGICIEVQAKVPAELKVSIYDMNVILSNLIDNSIEAVRKIENKKIEIEIIYSKNRLQIHIKNPCGDVLTNDKGMYLTTKHDRETHGYGLRNVRTIVERYDGIMEVKNKDNVFSAFVCLFLS